MPGSVLPFPGRPPVVLGASVHEVVDPDALLDVIQAIHRWVQQAEMPPEARQRRFAELVAAAAINALQPG